MWVKIEPKETDQIQKTSFLQQTAFWAEVKRKQGFQAKAFHFGIEDPQTEIGQRAPASLLDLVVLLKPLDETHSIAYVPYGPKIEPEESLQGQFLEELSEQLRAFLPKNCIVIRYDLPWESLWAKSNDYFDQYNRWLGPPEKEKQEFRFNFNTNTWNLNKANTDVLPSNTIFLDLKQKPESLLARMKSKTRYNIRLSLRKGVRVRAVGTEKLDLWYSLYKETARRNHIHLHDIRYFKTVLATHASHSFSPAETQLLIAEHNGTPLAAMFLAISGRRATYLYGASSSEKRNYMATYALQWKAMNIAKAQNCTEYDMFGISPNPTPAHPMYGLYRFKSGFGGTIFHRMGCWDYPLDPEKYPLFQAIEFNSQGYHN